MNESIFLIMISIGRSFIAFSIVFVVGYVLVLIEQILEELKKINRKNT